MSALDRIKQLEPIQFRYHSAIDPGRKLRAGFSAQQVQQVVPEAIQEIDGVLLIDLQVLRGIVTQARDELQRQTP